MATREPEAPEEQRELTSRWELVEGIFLPPSPPGRTLPWDEHVSSLRNMTLRDDDVFLCAYPKSGTHWIWEVASMLLQGKAVHESRSKVQLMIEFIDVKKLDEMPSPRILNTHLPFSMLPLAEMKARGLKIMHLYRNPKDTVVSYYHMLRNIERSGVRGFEEFFHNFFSEKAMYGSYFDYLRRMQDFIAKNPDVPVLTISFEDMKKNSLEKVKVLAQFLEVDVTDAVCEEIEKACRFDNMKKQALNKKEPVFGENPLPADSEQAAGNTEQPAAMEKFDGSVQARLFRKGQVGDWKNHLTVAMNEKADRVIKKQMGGVHFPLQFS